MSENLLEKAPPQDLSAEQAVLGAMLNDEDAVHMANSMIDASDFYKLAHQKIFLAVTAIVSEGKPPDSLLVEDWLRSKASLDVIGGPMYLLEISRETHAMGSIEYFCKIVRDYSIRRAVIRSGTHLIQKAFEPAVDMDDLAESAERTYLTTSQQGQEEGLLEQDDAIRKVLGQIEIGFIGSGLKTGFIDLDELTRGLKPGEFFILAGLPSQGKSTLALDISLNIASKGDLVGWALLEGSTIEFVRRSLACLSRKDINTEIYQSEEDLVAIRNAADRLSQMPILVDESPSQSLRTISARARSAVRMNNLKLLVVDYLQLVQVRKADSIFERVSAISVGLKNLAKELNIPILALSQFNREAPKSDRPRMYQMRGSGQLEQDADTVLILHEGQGYLDKNRSGPQGKFALTHFPEQFRFESALKHIENYAPDGPRADWKGF